MRRGGGGNTQTMGLKDLLTGKGKSDDKREPQPRPSDQATEDEQNAATAATAGAIAASTSATTVV